MTTLQKLQVKQSEIRESINALLGKDERSQDETADMERLTGEAQGLEVELRAALVASPDPQEVVTDTADPETRERLEIRSKTGLADFFAAAAGGREVVGAAREYADACGVSALNRLPMAIFPDGHQVEHRAITPGPAVDGPVQPVVPYVFERSAAASLGIEMPSVPAGQVQIPRISVAPPSDTLAKDSAAPSTAAAVVLDSQSPVRIAGQFEVRAEDLAVYPALEDALGQSMQGSLSNELDEETFNGAANRCTQDQRRAPDGRTR